MAGRFLYEYLAVYAPPVLGYSKISPHLPGQTVFVIPDMAWNLVPATVSPLYWAGRPAGTNTAQAPEGTVTFINCEVASLMATNNPVVP